MLAMPLLNNFSPLSVSGCGLWLEADRGITLVDGKVSQWNDLSGNGRHAIQTTANKRPIFETNIFNGWPALLFIPASGTGLVSTAGTNVLADIPGCTIFCVYKEIYESNASRLLFLNTFSNSTTRLSMYSESSTNPFLGNVRRISGDTAVSINTPNVYDTDAHIFCYTVNFVTGAMTIQQRDYSVVASGTLSNPGGNSDTSTQSTRYGIGWQFNSSTYYFSGYIAALIIYQRVLTDTERSKVHRYLGYKYGIDREEGGFNPRDVSNCAFWVESDRGVTVSGNYVVSWSDQSGYARDIYTTPTASGQRPTYVTNQLNGYPCINFDASTSQGLCPDSSWGAGDGYGATLTGIECFSLVKFYGGASTLVRTTAGDNLLEVSSDNIPKIGTLVWTTSVTGYHIIRTRATTTLQAISVDGASEVTLSKTVAWGNWGCLGFNGGADFDMAAQIIYNRELATSERQYIEQGLGSKYGITVS